MLSGGWVRPLAHNGRALLAVLEFEKQKHHV
jgi:hypothetical protein